MIFKCFRCVYVALTVFLVVLIGNVALPVKCGLGCFLLASIFKYNGYKNMAEPDSEEKLRKWLRVEMVPSYSSQIDKSNGLHGLDIVSIYLQAVKK